jgi:hypothetical protein
MGGDDLVEQGEPGVPAIHDVEVVWLDGSFQHGRFVAA